MPTTLSPSAAVSGKGKAVPGSRGPSKKATRTQAFDSESGSPTRRHLMSDRHHRQSDPRAVVVFALASMLLFMALFAAVVVRWWTR